MKHIIGFLIACCLISCNKDSSNGSAALLIKVYSQGDLLSNTVVTVESDSLVSGAKKVYLESPCGADDMVYFGSVIPGLYRVRATGYSVTKKIYLYGDTLFHVPYRGGENDYRIELSMK